MQLRKEEELTREIEDQLLAVQTGVEVDLDDHIGDDLLRLVFIACHPLLSPDARAALTLKMLGGLTTDEIARAFLVPEATVAQRIVRAKRTLADAGVPRSEERRLGKECVSTCRIRWSPPHLNKPTLYNQ